MTSIDPSNLPPVPGSTADMEQIEAKNRFWLFACVVSGIVFLGAPLVGILYTVIRMNGAYSSLGSDGLSHGVGDLGNHIGEVLVATLGGLLFAVLGLAIFILSIMKILKLRSARRLLEQHRLAASA